MDISKLNEITVTKTIDYHGEKIRLDILPNAEKSEDETNAEFAVRHLKNWDLTDKTKPFAITAENLKILPPELFTLILDAIYTVQQMPLGKLETLKQSAATSD